MQIIKHPFIGKLVSLAVSVIIVLVGVVYVANAFAYLQDTGTGHYFSVGPDGKPGTEDDLRLGSAKK